MRSCVWLICLTGCGRVGFDAVATFDASTPIGDPLISADPAILGAFQPPVLVDLSDPGSEDDDPCLTRDQLEIFFDSTRDGNNDLFTARRASLTAPWSTPVAISAVNTNRLEEYPQISGDGLTLYFTTRLVGGVDEDLWRSTRSDRDSPFGVPTPVENVNSTDEESMGSVDARDLVMVFSSLRGGALYDDLYESRRASTSEPWGAPVPIMELNAADKFERSAHIDDFGLVMYFEYGVFAQLRWTKRTSLDSPWSAPLEVTELNDEPGEQSDPWLSPDLRTIYFAVDGGPGVKDIYMATR